MNRPVKFGKKNAPEALIQKPGAKPKPTTSRNPLKELNSSSLPSTRSRDVPSRFGSLPLGSSSSSSGDSCNGSFSRSKSLPRTPKSALPDSRAPLQSNNPADSSELRSGVLLPRNPASRTRFGNLRQVGASNPQKPRATDHLHRRNSSEVGSNGSFQKKKKNADARGHGAAMAKHQDLPIGQVLGGVDVSAKGSNQESSTASIPGRRAPSPPLLVHDVGLERREVIHVGKIPNGSMLNASPNKDGEHEQQKLYSHTPRSTGTATPPVQASISPEILGGQSMMPTPACFAAGHLLTGVLDRRKCRPRGILNGGAGGVEMEEKQSFRSFTDYGDRCGASWTPPSMVEASMHWVSSPLYGEGGSERLTGFSSSASGVPLKDCPGEASVNWLLSHYECDTDESGLGNFPASSSTLTSNGASSSSKVFWRASPDATVDAAGNSPVFKGLDGFTSPQHKDTRCVLGLFCSPSADGSISPYSMILTKAGAWESFKDLSQEEDKERCCCGSLGETSPLSQSNGGDVCSSSLPGSNRQVDLMSSMGLHTMAQGVEAQSSSSSLSQALTSGSKNYLPLSALSFQFSYASTPSNSVDLACFQRNLCHQSSVREELSVGEDKSSYSDLRVSWRGGLISRIFEMDELDCCDGWSDKRESVDCQASSKLDLKFHQNSRSSLFTPINEMDVTKLANGLESVDLMGNVKNEQQCSAKGPFGSLFSCAESFSMEGNGLEASVDSDWSLFYQNNLFQV